MEQLAGISKTNREKLATIIRSGAATITVKATAQILEISNKEASIFLSNLTKNGWLSRIKNGLYQTMPLEAYNLEPVIENPYIIAMQIFSPCYIAGWSALEYWGLTEQLFSTNLVITTRKFANLLPKIKGAKFLLKVVKLQSFCGYSEVKVENHIILISDPTKTIIDILDDPKLAGGIRPASDALANYYNSEYYNSHLMIEYAEKICNRTIFKRLGFLMEYLKLRDDKLITECIKRISQGYTDLDPAIKSSNILRRWGLKIPANWKITYDTKE